MSISERDQDYLSSYIDEQLAPQERAALEARLASESDLRRELESLRTAVSLLKMAERIRVPRNFTLDPAKFGKPVQPLLWQRWGLTALTPLASAGAALAVIMILGGGVILTSSLRSPQADLAARGAVGGAQPQAPQAFPAAAMTEAPSEESMLAAEAPTPSASDTALASPVATPAVAGDMAPNSGGGFSPMPTQAVIVQAPPESGGQGYGGSPTSATLTDQGGAESAPAMTEKSSAGVPAEQPPADNVPAPAAANQAPASQPIVELPLLPFVGGGLALAGVGLLVAILARRRA